MELQLLNVVAPQLLLSRASKVNIACYENWEKQVVEDCSNPGNCEIKLKVNKGLFSQ